MKALIKGSIVSSVADVDYRSWWRGLSGSVIKGGASAVRASLAAMVALPGEVNIEHPWVLLKVAFVAFAIKGILAAAEFLEKEPIPELVTVEETTTTTKPDGTETSTSTTTTTPAVVPVVAVEPPKV